MAIEHHVRLEGERKTAIEIGRTRLMVAGALFCAAFLFIAGRLVDVTMLKTGNEPVLAHSSQPLEVRPDRANIYDRNGVLLASGLKTASLYANPQILLDPKEAARRLVGVMPELNEASLVAKLSSDRSFVWIWRHLTPRQQFEINKLGLPGLEFQREERRIYPMAELTSHVLGYTDIDNRGIAGAERYFDQRLQDDPHGLSLSLDVRVQSIMRRELSAAIAEFDAQGGSGIVLDVRTGEVVAMVSLPDFDPNMSGSIQPETNFNRNTLGVYEMGSTFKIFTAAIALETGQADLTTKYDATKPIRISRFSIRDYHAQNRWLTVPEIIMHSSNIGAARMAVEFGADVQRQYLGRFGLLRQPPIEIAEVGAPLLPDPWREISTMTIAYGHGLAVSPLQLASAVAAVSNGGVYHPPTLVKRDPGTPVPGTRVISAATSQKVLRLLRVVVAQGTGKFANADGYFVGGKTGTAEKISGLGYNRKSLLSSFVAVFPLDQPEYVVLVMLDEAKGTKKTMGFATGGWVAAPVVSKVISASAPLLDIQPVDETRQALHDRFHIEISGPEKDKAKGGMTVASH